MYAAGNATTLFSDAETVVNENSRDHDFRVETDSNNSAFVIDASDNEIELNANTFSGGQFTLGSSSFFLNVTNGYRFNDQANSVNLCVIGNSGEMNVNEGSQDYDFRVESNNNANMLFVDGGNDRVQIGTDSATFNGNTAANFVVVGGSTGSSNPVAIIADPDGSVEGGSCILELSFTGDTSFSSARMMQFRDLEATQGTIECSGTGTVTYNTSSDERLKEDIQDTSSKWEELKAIKVRDYKWKKSGVLDTGFVAQELNEHWPNAVSEGKEDEFLDPWTVDYGRLTPILTKALQEAMEKIETLEQEVAKLKGE
jgi:hypothetical protein